MYCRLSYQIKIARIISVLSTALGAGKGRKVEVERNICGVEKFSVQGVGKEGGKIYTKALLKRTKNNESRPGVYAAFVMVFQSTHIMLSLFHTMYHQYIFSRTFLLCGIGPRRKTARIPSSVYQPG